MRGAVERVAVLGLGRLGGALARRLALSGMTVTGWTRHSPPPAGVTTADSGATAVRDADAVVLALFDYSACIDVLDACLADVPDACVVVNVSTVGPDQAVALRDLVVSRGRRYLHCPVLGSVPAVEAGRLTALVDRSALTEDLGAMLAALGTVIPCPDVRTAAALKLLANGVLTEALVALGASLARAHRLQLDSAPVRDVLARSALGDLATSKRSWLEGADQPADFTVAALAKDVDLLVDAEPLSANLRDDLQAAAAVDAAARLDALPTVARDAALLAPLISYARGHATGDPTHFHDAFRPTAHIEGIRGGQFVSWNLNAYTANFSGHPAPNEASRRRTITELRHRGSVAHATMILDHGDDLFTDMFVLVLDDGAWRIANKVYHRD